MVYARCLYQLLMWADERQRTAFPLTRSRLSEFLRHACRSLGSELLKTEIGLGYVVLLVDMNADISITAFTDSLISWTSAWIAGVGQVYWTKVRYSPVSPEDNELPLGMCPVENSHPHCTMPTGVCHHIILITSRNRLLIPIKYRGLMAQVASDTANDLGAEVMACAAMRNHLHLLCYVPTHVSVSQFIDMLRDGLLQRMLANRHLRRAEGWSEHSVTYTVSPSRISKEAHTIADQDAIHSCRTLNEMSPLYQRLGIHYVASLH